MIEMGMDVAGERLVLHAERAVWWARTRRLLLADIHFGKGSVLRSSGVAVPAGQTAADLGRIDRLIEHYRPRQMIVLGDLVHGRSSVATPWVVAVQAWRQRHGDVAMQLVAGNHDRHFDARELGFDVTHDDLLLPPFLLRHAPARSALGYVLAGHVHPGITVRDGWRRHRLPAFRFEQHAGLLPAFGALTGLHEQPAIPGERVVAVTPAGLLDLYPAA